jgi:hypothetical protein
MIPNMLTDNAARYRVVTVTSIKQYIYRNLNNKQSTEVTNLP